MNLLSIGFVFLYSAFNTVVNLTPQILSDEGFGTFGYFSEAIIYLGLAIGSLLSSNILYYSGNIKTLVVGSLLYSIWVISYLLPTYYSSMEVPGPFYMQFLTEKN